MKISLKNIFLLLLMVAIGIAGMLLMKSMKQGIQHDKTAMPAKLVDVISIKQQDFSATVTAYGNIEPAVMFEGKAELSGKISYVHPELKAGGAISAGTVVVRINAEDYEVSLNQTKADLASSQSQLKQLEQEKDSTRQSLKLAKDNLDLGKQELTRIESVWKKRLISRSTLDSEKQKVLQLRQTVEDLQGKLNTYSNRLNNAKAQIDRSQQQVKGKKTTLQRTEIILPFDARISSASLDKGEFVSVGTTLFEAINTDGVEVQAELPIKNMRILLSASNGNTLNLQSNNTQNVLKQLQLKAQVKLVGGHKNAVWDAKVIRFSESIDPKHRTLAVTILVENPYENIIVGEHPPLLKGMYVAVELSSPSFKAIVIPRKAIHLGRAYIVNSAGKLEIRPLDIRFKQGNIAVINAGLAVGEQLIINDLMPVIEGMPLTSQVSKPKLNILENSPDAGTAKSRLKAIPLSELSSDKNTDNKDSAIEGEK
jgi:multidrug efflux pump subunit AcrA (membrane-fusion protein)